MQINENHHNEWQKLIEEQKTSGLSKRAFCKQRGINVEKFYYHARGVTRLKSGMLINQTSQFLPVQVKKSTLPVKATEHSSIRLILKNGIECILPDGIESKRIKEVIEVLQQC